MKSVFHLLFSNFLKSDFFIIFVQQIIMAGSTNHNLQDSNYRSAFEFKMAFFILFNELLKICSNDAIYFLTSDI